MTEGQIVAELFRRAKMFRNMVANVKAQRAETAKYYPPISEAKKAEIDAKLAEYCAEAEFFKSAAILAKKDLIARQTEARIERMVDKQTRHYEKLEESHNEKL